LNSVANRRSRQPAQFNQLLLGGDLVARHEYPLSDLLNQPRLQLKVLGDRTVFIEDHSI